jgi:hypothetical protein
MICEKRKCLTSLEGDLDIAVKENNILFSIMSNIFQCKKRKKQNHTRIYKRYDKTILGDNKVNENRGKIYRTKQDKQQNKE